MLQGKIYMEAIIFGQNKYAFSLTKLFKMTVTVKILLIYDDPEFIISNA